ncbi:hypothetical protein [Streptomyces virginiae]
MGGQIPTTVRIACGALDGYRAPAGRFACGALDRYGSRAGRR